MAGIDGNTDDDGSVQGLQGICGDCLCDRIVGNHEISAGNKLA